ncbi:hypothetical protein KKA17_05525 [bacterium]|nr:hypothetical protein [bacterium]MBU1883994.1 hypothetical protein [bacterium]
MDTIIYDIFIKGVIPLAIIGILGFAAKTFLSLEGAIKRKLSLFTIVVLIIIGGLYFQYLFLFSGYRAQFVPETTNIPGAISKTNEIRSYWEVTKDITISLPILVKDDREISVYLEIENPPLTIEYHSEGRIQKVLLENKISTLFEHKLTNDLIDEKTYISESISKNDEKILTIKAKTNANTKIFSYFIERYYSPVFSWIFFISTSLLWLIPTFYIGNLSLNKSSTNGNNN